MSTRADLVQAVNEARAALEAAENALYAFETLAENNVFSSLKEAEGKLEDELHERAFQDCQGAHNRGDDQYTQEFIVDGVKYVAVYDVEYNRHDKMYYYIDGHKFSIKKVDAEPSA